MLTLEQINCIAKDAECPVYSAFSYVAEKACYTSSIKIEERNIADWQLLYTVRELKDNWTNDPRLQCLAKKLMR